MWVDELQNREVNRTTEHILASGRSKNKAANQMLVQRGGADRICTSVHPTSSLGPVFNLLDLLPLPAFPHHTFNISLFGPLASITLPYTSKDHG